ncbi:MAG: hypothetical protein E7282_08385 [Lachnospiraceae bacterium]|nr:hypothetical protein [Lachnospiraceae bacterium]
MKAASGNATIQFGDKMFPLEGFKAVHDMPKVSAIVIEQNDTKVAIISIEIVMLWDDFVERLRNTVAGIVNIPVENVWIHMTHAITTPHAPGGPLIGLGGAEVELTEEEKAKRQNELSKRDKYEEAILEALKDSLNPCRNLREAKMYIGTANCPVVKNRDIQTQSGWWIGVDGVGEVNETMTVICFRDESDNDIAQIVGFGMKPCVIDNAQKDTGNRLISADAPGMMCRNLETQYHCPVLYITGAAGDTVPEKTAWFDREDLKGEIECVDLGVKTGIKFAKAISEKMVVAANHAISDASEIRVSELKLLHTEFVWQTKGRVPMHPYQSIQYIAEGEKNISVDGIVMGDLALVAGKPEMNAITGIQLENGSKFKHTLYVSMLNGGMKYMPDQKSYDEIHWEALTSMLMPGAAEKFVETALDLINHAI